MPHRDGLGTNSRNIASGLEHLVGATSPNIFQQITPCHCKSSSSKGLFSNVDFLTDEIITFGHKSYNAYFLKINKTYHSISCFVGIWYENIKRIIAIIYVIHCKRFYFAWIGMQMKLLKKKHTHTKKLLRTLKIWLKWNLTKLMRTTPRLSPWSSLTFR